MSNSRISKKHMQIKAYKQYNEIKRYLAYQEEMTKKLSSQMEKQQEILGLFYKEYQELKHHTEKQYLLTYIRMRESMIKDMNMYEKNGQTSTQGYKLLSMYVNEYTDILEDHGVEILECTEAETFNPEIQRPIEKINVGQAEYNNLICKVYSSGYRWKGFLLKKIDVAVGIYN